MLSPTLAGKYGLTMREMIQMRCNFCHRHDAATPGMDEINLAKVLFKKKKCLLSMWSKGEVARPLPN